MKKTIEKYLPVAESIQKLFYPYVEVVIHDIETNKIIAIYNSFSKRVVGDDSLLTQDELEQLDTSTGPYDKTNWDGRKLKSVSNLITDEEGKPVAIMCINLDISPLNLVKEQIELFVSAASLKPQPDALFRDDWQERVNRYIHQYLMENHLSLKTIKRAEKKKLIEHLFEVGAFTGKNTAGYIAEVLGISRATVYNYLNEAELLQRR